MLESKVEEDANEHRHYSYRLMEAMKKPDVISSNLASYFFHCKLNYDIIVQSLDNDVIKKKFTTVTWHTSAIMIL